MGDHGEGANSFADASDQGSLRDRTRARMRAEVREVAFRLFAEQGFANTTVEQIAAAAGLSRATFFRYFGSKEDLVLNRIIGFGREVADALAARPAEEPPWQALRRAFDVIAEPRPGQEPSQDMTRLLSEACALMTKQWDKTQGWPSMLTPELARRLGGTATAMQARVLVVSAIACLDAACDAWDTSDGSTPLPVLVDQAMGFLHVTDDPTG
jgi:AcrR family transcriptional regulator